MSLQFGIDVLLSDRVDLIAGRKVGLISNASGVTSNLVDDANALRETPGIQLAALFGPEHGFTSVAADGAPVESRVDARTGLPVYSLFGQVRKPTSDMLDGLDILLFDIQTVGVRFYTYVTTLLLAMQAAAENGKSLIVCDRPNPIGGEILEGPVLERGFESFVGPGPLPIRHRMTVGELARLFNEEWAVGCDLTVVPCTGWRRGMWYGDTGLPWAPPSPAMPWPDTAIVYPGTCLVEGTNLSEGRGTALPFHLVGAPWIDGQRLAESLNRLELVGVRFHGTTFQPTADKWAGQRCGGIQLHVIDRDVFRAVSAGLHVIQTVKRLYPEEFEFRAGSRGRECPYVDLLSGTAEVRQQLEDDASVPDLVAGWQDELDEFARTSAVYCVYD